jgi:hypothetical protein
MQAGIKIKKSVQVEIKVKKVSHYASYRTQNDWGFICQDWVEAFFGVSQPEITVCFSDTDHADSYWLRHSYDSSGNVKVFQSTDPFSEVLFEEYAHMELRRVLEENFPSGDAFISIYL